MREAYKSGEFDDMFNEAALDNMAAEDMVAYSESKLRYEDDLAALDYRYDEGKAEGIDEGRAIGKDEGFIEGKETGKAEERITIARTMIEFGLPTETISQITGLSPEEVRQLTIDK